MRVVRLPALVRTTTFRLAMIHAALFTIFSGALLLYLFLATAGRLEREANDELRVEVNALSATYLTGGFARLNQSVIERSTARGPFFYLLTEADGSKVSGDFDMLPATAPEKGQADVSFEYEARNLEGEVQKKLAEGRMVRFQDGSVLLVAYDTGARGEIVSLVTNTVWRSAFAGLILSFLGGVLVSRSASRRVEALAKTTEDVMAGDLTRRAPAFGSGDEFDRLAERLNAMLDRLERLVTTSRHAGDAIAHDLRSPLSRLRNHLEDTLAQAPENPDWEGAIAFSIEQVDRVLDTFNAILRLSHVQGGGIGKLDRVDASALMHELAELYDPVCEDKGLSFKSDIRPHLFIHADRSLIAQVVVNLLDNAVKYTPSGSVTLCARRRSGEVELSVIDSGPGIPAADRPKVIERFFRLEKARTEPGSGLGLSLVAAVADMHRGRLELGDGESGPNGPGLRASLLLKSA